MKFVLPRLPKLASLFLLAAALLPAHGQNTNLTKAGAASKTNALPKLAPRQTIEFSGSATAPALPKPNSKTADLEGRFGIPNGDGSLAPDMMPDIGTANVPLPSRSAMDKAWKNFDRKKNWMVPGAQDEKSDDPSKALTKEEEEMENEDGLAGNKSVMQRFLSGESTSKRNGRGRGREGDEDKDSDRSDEDRDRRDANGKNDKGRDRDRDRERERENRASKNDGQESNALNDFRLGAYLNQGSQPSAFGDMSPRSTDRWNQSLRGELGSRPKDDNTRAQAREREAAHSADFQQLIRPRGASANTSAGGFSDPINMQSDLTRREINPILPRGLGGPNERASFSISSPMGQPPRDNLRLENLGILGVTGPAASSLAPTVSAPMNVPRPPRNFGIVPEAPSRPY